MDKKERASRGGHARAAKLTPQQRSEIARKAVNARWAKVRAGRPRTYTVSHGSSLTIFYDG